jgi:hypothetical protein
MDKIGIVHECVAHKRELLVCHDILDFEPEATFLEHVDDGNADEQSNAWSGSVFLVHSLERDFDARIGCHRVAKIGPYVVVHLC